MAVTEFQHWSELGQIVKTARVEAGLTQTALAARAQVSRAWLARVEAGHRKAELEVLMKVLTALGLSLAVVPRPDDPEDSLSDALRQLGLT